MGARGELIELSIARHSNSAPSSAVTPTRYGGPDVHEKARCGHQEPARELASDEATHHEAGYGCRQYADSSAHEVERIARYTLGYRACQGRDWLCRRQLPPV